MDVKIQTPNWEIVDSGSIILADDYVEFLIEGLTFRLFVNDGPEQGNEATAPYVQGAVEVINGVRIMCLRAYNYSRSELVTMLQPLNMAMINGRRLFFRFSSSRVEGENGVGNHLIHYCWYLSRL